LKKIVPLIVHQHEVREILCLDLPDYLYVESLVIVVLDFLDVLFGRDRSRPPDRTQVEKPPYFLQASFYLFAAV